jgi:hypothetical protein
MFGSQLFQLHSQYESAGVVVGGISLFAVRDGKDGMLQHSGVISHPAQMVQFERRQLIQSTICE